MHNIRIYLIILFCSISTLCGISQIVAPYSDYADTAAYSYLISGTDSLFFFTPENDSTFIIADTSGLVPDSVRWEIFLPGTGYQPLGNTNIKLMTNPSPTGTGYRLTSWKNGANTISGCWVFSYSFDCFILTKDNDDTLLTSAYTGDCDRYGPIKLKIQSDTIIYYNLLTLDTIYYTSKFKREWFKELNVSEGNVVYKGQSNGLLLYNIENAYWENMWYWITVSDSLGRKQTDSVFVKSINPHAEFDWSYIKLDNPKYYPDKDSNYYFFYGEKSQYEAESAPAYYLFESTSKNAHEYLWNFGDSTTYKTTSDTVLKIYTKWSDNYVVTLTAIHIVEWSGKQCTSTKITDGEIKVAPPKLQTPNFFSVNSSQYPAWRFYDVSITDFEISIFSRYGIRVHHFEGNIRDWEGWDGRINNSDNYASTGVYYYVVKDFNAIHNIDPDTENGSLWGENSSSAGQTGTPDNPPTSDSGNNEHRGFIHLFNNE
jgi:hypothetical protein